MQPNDKPREDKARNLSRHQYGTLKYIAENKVTLAYLRHAHANTLGSIAYWNWIAVQGKDDNSLVVLTKSGQEQLYIYTHASLNERGKEGELTARCLRLLKHTRRVVEMRKSA